MFALFEKGVVIDSADYILNTTTKFTRNLDYTNTDGVLTYADADEYLLAYHASTSVAGSLENEITTLSPNTDYSLYFAYEFVNGKKWLKLLDAKTEPIGDLES